MFIRTPAKNAFNKKGKLRVFTTTAVALAAGCLSTNAQTGFTSNVDFSKFNHGTILSASKNLSNSSLLQTTLTVISTRGGFDQTVIFDTSDGSAIDDTASAVNDNASGGTLSFDLTPVNGVTIDSFQIDLLDVKNADSISIFAFDATGFTVEFTGDQLVALQSDIMFGDDSATGLPFSATRVSQASLGSISPLRLHSLSITSPFRARWFPSLLPAC